MFRYDSVAGDNIIGYDLHVTHMRDHDRSRQRPVGSSRGQMATKFAC